MDEEMRKLIQQLANTRDAGSPDAAMSNMASSLASMESMMQNWARNGFPSQANQKTFSNNRKFNDDYDSRNRGSRRRNRGFVDSLEDELLQGLLGSDFRKDIASVFKGFAERIGSDVEDIPDALGKQLGSTIMSAFKNTTVGKDLTARLDAAKKNFLNNLTTRGNVALTQLQSGQVQNRLTDRLNRHLDPLSNTPGGIRSFAQGAVQGVRGGFDIVRSGFRAIRNAPSELRSMFQPSSFQETSLTNLESSVNGFQEMDLGDLLDSVGESFNPLQDAAESTTSQLLEVAEGGGDAASMFSKLGPQGLVAAGALVALEVVTDRLGRAFSDVREGVTKVFSAISGAANRDAETRKKNLEAYKKRMQDDYRTLVEAPFNLLKEAAQSLYDSWNNNLTVVSATQGYSKEDVLDLMARYSERVMNAGLSKYVSSTDLYDNLANVLKTGMSGDVAEEFAYQATLLNKAVPNQDFFSYASTYSSIAANAIRDGKSQQEAIAEANESLNSFASNLLYTSRELTGGFTTGLQNASSIYEEAAKISVAANSDNQEAISGVLLAIQGYVGAVAPDLASALTDTIYKLTTGGNDPSIVALRSLAGINASNTEFLQAFANDPQAILSSLFDNLANMFEQSPDAYMEKAEGYASLFGLDAQAFQRVDFNELANAINSMNLENESLNENMALLLAGQTTTSTAQLKQQQINEIAMEEGLAYVIDNQVAQMVKQHMWDEQLAREITQSEFSVALVGEAKEGLLKIGEGVQKILDFLNPFSWLKKLGNVVNTQQEFTAQQADVRQLLELSKVGKGTQTEYTQLTTYNQDLGIVKPIVEQMGGNSAYKRAAISNRRWDNLTNPLYHANDSISGLQAMLAAEQGSYSSASKPSSVYSWGMVSKSQSEAANSILTSGVKQLTTSIKSAVTSSSSNVSAATAKAALDKMMDEDYIKNKFVKQGKTYEDWAATASKFGIADLSKAIEAVGYAEADIQKFFEDAEAKAGQEEAHERNLREEDFWKSGQHFWDEYYPEDFDPKLFDELGIIEETYLQSIIDNQLAWAEQFDDSWTDWNTKVDTAWASWTKHVTTAWTSWLGSGDGKQSGAWGHWISSWNKWKGTSKDAKTWAQYTADVSDFWGFGSKKSGTFQELYKLISDRMAYNSYYGVSSGSNISSSKLLKELENIKKEAKKEDRDSVADQMGKVLSETLINDKSTDPALQTNILLGQILVYVGQIVQQTNSPGGGTSFVEQLSAMALGLTQTTP